MEVFRALLHDVSAAGGAAHRAVRAREDGWAVGPLVVPDDRLSAQEPDVDLSVVVGGGAGGVSALARRTAALRLVSVETVLRDLDDLAGNAARVVAAAAELPDGTDLYVGVPPAPGFVAAVEVVEAAGLLGRVDLASAGGPGGSAARLSVLVEADLPFKVTGLAADPFAPSGVVALLMAVEALVDGAEPEDADALLTHVDERRAVAALDGWDPSTQARVRRRLRGADCTDPVAALDALRRTGLL